MWWTSHGVCDITNNGVEVYACLLYVGLNILVSSCHFFHSDFPSFMKDESLGKVLNVKFFSTYLQWLYN